MIRGILAVLACAPLAALAQYALEIIPLRHRTVEQVVPVLQPLVEPGGTLTGQSNQLIVRTSPRNLADLRAALDRARDAISASGRVGNRGAEIDVRAQGRREAAREQVEQRIQVLEGGRAFIATGESRPLQDAMTGFDVVPRLSGDAVFLEIGPQRERPGAVPGSVQSQRVATSVRTRLGEWTEVGATGLDAARDASGIGAASRSSATGSRSVWLKVEALD